MDDQSFHDRLARINASLGTADAIGQTIVCPPVEPAHASNEPKTYNQLLWTRITTNIFLGILWMLPTALAIYYFRELSIWFENEPGTADSIGVFARLGPTLIVDLFGLSTII